jgi:hypothetical protein
MIGSGGSHCSLLRIGIIRKDKDYTENSARRKNGATGLRQCTGGAPSIGMKAERYEGRNGLLK